MFVIQSFDSQTSLCKGWKVFRESWHDCVDSVISEMSVDDDGVFCSGLADTVFLKPLGKKYAHIFWGVFIKTR